MYGTRRNITITITTNLEDIYFCFGDLRSLFVDLVYLRMSIKARTYDAVMKQSKPYRLRMPNEPSFVARFTPFNSSPADRLRTGLLLLLLP